MITVCPSCTQSLECEDDTAGTLATCPTCENVFELPGGKVPPPLVVDAPPILKDPLQSAMQAGGMVCCDCGEVGKGKLRGNPIIELALWLGFLIPGLLYTDIWLCFIIPGAIYTQWRYGGKVCKKCDGKMVKVSSPRGIELVKRYHS